jgi:Phage minor structural protein GP20
MKRDFLTELGLETEQVNKIMAEHGKTVNTLKDDADKAKEKAGELEKQLKDRDTQLDDLSKKAKGNEDLMKQISDLQEANKQTAADYQAKLDKQAFDFSLEKALADAKAKNPKAVKALLNTEAIKLDGEKLLGLEEQLKALQESDSYLFGAEEQPSLKGRKPNDDPTPPATGLTKEQFKQMSYSDRVKVYNENHELYKQLSE